MTQDMHNWIASVMLITTVLFVQRKQLASHLDGEFGSILLFIFLVMYVIMFGIWLIRIV